MRKARVVSLGKIIPTQKNVSIDMYTRKVDENNYVIELDRIHTMCVKIPDPMYKMLSEAAEKEKTTISDIVRRAISDYLSKKK